MLIRLLKHEMRQMNEELLLPHLLLPVLYGLLWVSSRGLAESGQLGAVPFDLFAFIGQEHPGFLLRVFFLGLLVCFGLQIAAAVLTLVNIYEHFARDIVGSKGILYHSLPVEPWQLLLSRFLPAALWFFLDLLVQALSLTLLYSLPNAAPIFFNPYARVLFSLLDFFPLPCGIILSFYAACTVSHQFSSMRLAAGFLTLCGIGWLWSVFDRAETSFYLHFFRERLLSEGAVSLYWSIIPTLLFDGVVFAFTAYMLRRHLDLAA